MTRSYPKKIASFHVVLPSVLESRAEDGTKVQRIMKEHVFALDSEGLMWVRNVEERDWYLFNP